VAKRIAENHTPDTRLGSDEATKEILIEAGAEPWSIYTRDELQRLVARNRIAPLSQDDLKKVHTLKRTFNARIAE